MNVVDSWVVLVVDDPRACRDWYREHLDFDVRFDAGWYIQLELSGPHRLGLAFLQTGHPTQPLQHHPATSGARFVSIQLDSVDDLAERLLAAGSAVDVPLRDEPWGQRHIIVKDPGGNSVDLIAAIEPDPEFAKLWFS